MISDRKLLFTKGCISNFSLCVKPKNILGVVEAVGRAPQPPQHQGTPINQKKQNRFYPKAAFAGALQVKLNGPARYHGQLVDKPFIGVGFADPTEAHIHHARQLMVFSSGIAVFVFSVLLIGLQYLS